MKLSLDISTTNAGIIIFDDYNNLLEVKHIKIIDGDLITKGKYIEDILNKIQIDYNGSYFDYIFIEAPFVSTNVNNNTTALLLGFNAVIQYICYNIFNVTPTMISVHQARKFYLPEFITYKVNKKTNEIKETLSFPKEMKTKDKKEYIYNKIKELNIKENNSNEEIKLIEWFKNKRTGSIDEKNFDISDSYIIMLAGIDQQ